MTDLSNRRRRAGRLLVGAAALALPLTASITYAQDAGPNPPAPPVPPTASAAPLPPIAPTAPANPLAPEAPLPPVAGEPRIVIDEESPDGTRKERRVMVFRSTHGDHPAKALGAIPHVERRIVMRGKDGKMLAPDSPEFKAHMERFEKEMEGLGERIEKSVVIDEKHIERFGRSRGGGWRACREHGAAGHRKLRRGRGCERNPLGRWQAGDPDLSGAVGRPCAQQPESGAQLDRGQ